MAHMNSVGEEQSRSCKAPELFSLLGELWHYDSVLSSVPYHPFRTEADGATESTTGPLFQTPLSNEKHIQCRVFSIFDKNGDGVVTVDEICRTLEDLGLPNIRRGSVESLLAELSVDSLENVDEKNFNLLCSMICNANGCSNGATDTPTPYNNAHTSESASCRREPDNSEDLLEAFQVFDKDDNGFISASELQFVLISLGFPAETCSIEDCSQMIARVDANGDGFVDFIEFQSMFQLHCRNCNVGDDVQIQPTVP